MRDTKWYRVILICSSLKINDVQRFIISLFQNFTSFFKLKTNFISILAVLGLHCCAGFSLLYSEQGLFFVVHGLLIAVASLVSKYGPQGVWASVVVVYGLSICGSWALEHTLHGCSTNLVAPWHVGLPRPGVKRVSPALAGGFFTTEPPGKPFNFYFILEYSWLVRWALESITINKASGGDRIPVELFQILKDDAVKVLHSICQQIWKTQQWPQHWKRSVFIPIPKKGNAKECSKLPHNCTHLTR